MKKNITQAIAAVTGTTAFATISTALIPLQAFARERAQVVSITNPEYTAASGSEAMFILFLGLLSIAIPVAAIIFIVKKIIDKKKAAKQTPMYYHPQANYQPQTNYQPQNNYRMQANYQPQNAYQPQANGQPQNNYRQVR